MSRSWVALKIKEDLSNSIYFDHWRTSPGCCEPITNRIQVIKYMPVSVTVCFHTGYVKSHVLIKSNLQNLGIAKKCTREVTKLKLS